MNIKQLKDGMTITREEMEQLIASEPFGYVIVKAQINESGDTEKLTLTKEFIPNPIPLAPKIPVVPKETITLNVVNTPEKEEDKKPSVSKRLVQTFFPGRNKKKE